MPRTAPNYSRARADIGALLQLMHTVHSNPHMTGPDIAYAVGVSLATVKRMMVELRESLDVKISWDYQNGYQITDWGLINRARLLG